VLALMRQLRCRHRGQRSGRRYRNVQQQTPFKKEERVMAEKVSTQAKEAVEKMSAATSEAAGAVQNSYSVALKGLQDYNKKWFEFTQANTQAAMDFYQKVSGVKSPSEFIELSTEHAQKQLTTLTEQTKQLAELAQRVTLEAAEPLKTGFTKASGGT
jgi:phasin